MSNGPKVANMIVLSQYFENSFKNRGVKIMIYILLEPIKSKGQSFCFAEGFILEYPAFFLSIGVLYVKIAL